MGAIWKLKEILLVIFILKITAQTTQRCAWSALTEKTVPSCPATEEGTQKAARIKKCLGIGLRQNCTNPLQFKYHCLFSLQTETLVEVCAPEMSINGVCLVYNAKSSKLDLLEKVKCTDFSTPCPEKYLSTKAHLDAPCHTFVNLTSNFASNEEKTETTKTTNILLWSLFPTLLSIIIIMGIVMWKRKQRQKKIRKVVISKPDQEQNDTEDKDGVPVSESECKSLLLSAISEMNQQRKSEETTIADVTENIVEPKKRSRSSDDNGIYSRHCLGDYHLWRTKISDQFSTLSDDEVSVLYCFLCSDFGPPDFTDTEWLDMLNAIRQEVCDKGNPVTSDEAQFTLDRLKTRDFLWEDQDRINGDTKDETMYRIASIKHDIPFIYSSYDTARVYLIYKKYSKRPKEKCIISDLSANGHLLIRRLQMNILTHVTMEDTDIYDVIEKTLNIPKNKLKDGKEEQEKFLMDLRKDGEAVHYRGRSQDSVQHVTWLWRYGLHARPDIVRSCIGLHPHGDIYVINNVAYRKSSNYHRYLPDVRCLLYCLLLADEYTIDTNEDSYKSTINKIRDRYFEKEAMSNDISKINVPEGIIRREDNKIMFTSDDIRHDVMYAFVTECLLEESDLEFFLTTASGHVISDYCRSWWYKRSDGERCLYVPVKPDMLDPVIDRLQLDIITHCSISDEKIRNKIRERLGVPIEILSWDKEARKRYAEYAKRCTQTVHHARGMIVGCAGAGKTTLLKRLMGCTKEELRNVKSTKGLDVHEEELKIDEETKTLKESTGNEDDEIGKGRNAKTLSFFDFGGQSAYYACHQIYLTRRAFYIVVVDASKHLDQIVDKAVCVQEGSLFSGWTYGDYFVFWLKSIDTYCSEGDQKPMVLLVATHWEHKIEQYKDKDALVDNLCMHLSTGSHLSQYIKGDSCYCIQFEVPIVDLERRIVNIASHSRWEEKIPKEWAMFGIYLYQTKENRILNTSSIEINATENDDTLRKCPDDKTLRKEDMLRFHHDAGKVLHFNENGLREIVIIDVQWFVDAFKDIITDKLHFEGFRGISEDWEEYFQTGNLRYRLLEIIWRETKRSDVLHHIQSVLLFMQRLGLVAVGEESCYVPCMNRKDMDVTFQKLIAQSESRSSVLVYRFDVLPFFFFFRLVVACMQEKSWKLLKDKGISHLYKNAALFAFEQYNFILSVTADSIQLQVFHHKPLDEEKTRQIQSTVDRLLFSTIGKFHRKLNFEKGIRCQEDKDKPFAMEIRDHFLEYKKNTAEENVNHQLCPLHQDKNIHFINSYELKKYWNP